MFKYIKHKDINFELWDECINNSKNGIIYALSWYLNITAPGWEAIVKEEEGKYIAVMPIPVFKKFGIRYVKQPILCQQLGIFNWDHEIDQTAIENIFTILKNELKYIQKYEFNTENGIVFKTKSTGFNFQTFKTYHLDLNKSYQEISKNYKSDRRWRINKAKKSQIIVKESEDIDLLIRIFHENVSQKIYGIIGEKYEYQILKDLYVATKEKGMGKLLSAEDMSGQVLAMGLFFRYNRKIIYIFNASTPEGKNLSAISLVVDRVLKAHAGQSLCFDFESPEIPKVAEFYRRFGSVATIFPSISYNELPVSIKIIRSIRLKLYRQFVNSPNNIQQ